MAASLGCAIDQVHGFSALGYRQQSSLFCSTSQGSPAFSFASPVSVGKVSPAVLHTVCKAKGSAENCRVGHFQSSGHSLLRTFWKEDSTLGRHWRGPSPLQAKGRSQVEEPDEEFEGDEPLDMEVVDIGDDNPFNEPGLSFEEAPVKAAKKSMEERLALQSKAGGKRDTEMKEFTDASGKAVFLEVAIQDKSPEELEALAWRDRDMMDDIIRNRTKRDSQTMDPFTFRAKLPEAVHDNDEFVFVKSHDVETSDDEDNEWFRDDTDCEPNEEWYVEDWAGPLTVVELEHTRFMMPSAWEGKLDDGRKIYIKHRYGILNVMVLDQRGWRKKYNTVYYILHKHFLNSQCTTVRMRELLEGKILNFACEIVFADRFDNVYDMYEGYDVERKALRSSNAHMPQNWELQTDLTKRDKVAALEQTREAFWKQRRAATNSQGNVRDGANAQR